MTNDEWRMTKEIRNPKAEIRKKAEDRNPKSASAGNCTDY